MIIPKNPLLSIDKSGFLCYNKKKQRKRGVQNDNRRLIKSKAALPPLSRCFRIDEIAASDFIRSDFYFI